MKKFGFTLVELLIVIMIIGILATMAVPQYNKMVQKAKWSEAVNMFGTIIQAMEVYYAEHSDYPARYDNLDAHTYLNGPGAIINTGLLMDVPSQSKFTYAINCRNHWNLSYGNPGYGVFAFIDNGDGEHRTEPSVGLHQNGTYWKYGDAPQFSPSSD